MVYQFCPNGCNPWWFNHPLYSFVVPVNAYGKATLNQKKLRDKWKTDFCSKLHALVE